MCVTECPDGPSEYNLYKSKVVASVHFSSENSACLLVHNLDKENNVNDDNYIKAKILFGYIDKESLKRLTATIIDVNIKHDRTLKKEWKSLLAGDENFISSDGKRKNFIYPLFMNVTNNCRLVNAIPNNNCNQHGLVIATPKHLIYHPLFSENLNFEINVSILLLKKIK
ncbi:29773_t:CDS:2 [Gigaspora margarita]|uniref:29773_t:CDS:1 n=1 Tax=Gigaspora margarita TaxID=4874 RepID=A0ABM8W3M3_GIGMA|nr:29773_t:CDS:2 [Gigaspora margarita]